LPRLGEGADSGTVASIFVKEGETVKKDQPVLELESEKAVASIPSPAAGTVTQIHVKEGDLIKVGHLIMTISPEGAGVEPPPSAPSEIPRPAESSSPPAPVSMPELPLPSPGPPPAASPTVRKIARDLNIDLARVKGSERGGRVTLADLKAYVQRLQQIVFQQQSPPAGRVVPASAPVVIDFAKWGPVERKKMTTLRKTISERMVQSWNTIPHIHQFDEVDISGLLAFKKKYGAKYEKQGGRLTLTAFAIAALVPALKKHPMFNTSFDETTAEIVFKNYYHFGIAVDTEHGLIVPVIRNADKKSLLDLARELDQLAERTRGRKVSLEEMQGGTFSISNQGGIGSGHFTPIVNKPEVAILGIGRGVVKPVVVEKKIEQRTMLPLTLSYDHRIIDGADAARFMVDLVKAFEGISEAAVRI
jgi:pyruvate dehydrogenase E2 component (dihydrolipoamide acetyltransferase)